MGRISNVIFHTVASLFIFCLLGSGRQSVGVDDDEDKVSEDTLKKLGVLLLLSHIYRQ